jgi:hypothetical protein
MLNPRIVLVATMLVSTMFGSVFSTSSNSPLTTGSIGYGRHNADFSLRPACASGFGNDRPCSS